MPQALRPYVTAGVALVGAGLIAVRPAALTAIPDSWRRAGGVLLGAVALGANQ